VTKPEAEVTLKSIEALQLLGAQIAVRLAEVDQLMIAADELLKTFKVSLEQTLKDINRSE